VVANGIVYVGSADNKLYAFDASCRQACQPLWSYATGGGISSSPAAANGLVYVGSHDTSSMPLMPIAERTASPSGAMKLIT